MQSRSRELPLQSAAPDTFYSVHSVSSKTDTECHIMHVDDLALISSTVLLTLIDVFLSSALTFLLIAPFNACHI